MIGLVIVSHSAKVAEGVCELMSQVARGNVRVAAAGGTGDPENPFGTDAYKVLEAIESVYSDNGVLVLMDLGSAVLSAETAMELLDPEKRVHVQLCAAPLVEGAVAAASLSAAGAGLEEIAREAEGALLAKPAHFAAAQRQTEREPADGWLTKSVRVPNRLGLHARPAAEFVRLARRFEGSVTVVNETTRSLPADGASISGLLGLAIRQGNQVLIRTSGTAAREALDALGGFLESGCGENNEPEEPRPAPAARVAPDEGQLQGMPASAGIAVGPLMKLHPAPVREQAAPEEDPEEEWRRLLAAIAGAQQETRGLLEWATAHIGAKEAAVFDAQQLMLEDRALVDGARSFIFERHGAAELAWQEATEGLVQQFSAAEDPYLRARIADIEDVRARVLRRLSGVTLSLFDLTEPAILTAHDIVPSMVKELDAALVLGLCLESGSASAHSVILARARGIPVVTGLGPQIALVPEGTRIGVDGERGLVWVTPGDAAACLLEQRRLAWLERRRDAQRERQRPACTRDGSRVRVFGNINSVADAGSALQYGAEGVGVLRTEFLFLGRGAMPGEEEQISAYRAIAEALSPRPVVIRTLDAGGDKKLPYLDFGEENNPFLGWRGIRVTLSRADLFRTQLRAILRAGAGLAVEVLLPMISTLVELRQARAILRDVEAELEREGKALIKNARVGVMIEVPAAVAIADQLASEADFFSIGTNDLVQYAMAADRTNSRVAAMADTFQPAVLRMIGQSVDAAGRAGISTTLCGEMAADPLATALLIGLGIEEFSVSAPLIPEVKQAIGRCSLQEAEAIARHALTLDSSDAVRRYLVDSQRPQQVEPAG